MPNTDTSLVHDNTTNLPDYALEEAARLGREYNNLEAEIEEAVAQCRAMPSWSQVNTAEDAEAFTAAITRLRDLDQKIEALREGEKLPHLRKGTAVDNYFNRMRDKLFRRKKTDPVGVADEMQGKLHDYNMRRLREEQRIRDEEAARQRAEEARLRAEREAAERAEREAAQKAVRARNEENRKRAEQEAAARRAEADRIAAEEAQRRAQRQEAEAAANVKPADMVRERHAGAINTMRLVWQVTVQDSMALDVNALWPFVDDKAKQKAAEQWAKVTNYKKTMAGLKIEQVPETVVKR